MIRSQYYMILIFGMNKGEITGLIGPNGAGKSTMLKLMIKKNGT